MSNIKLTGHTWDTSGIYDAEQEKTQKQVNADVSELKTAIGELANEVFTTETLTAITGKYYKPDGTLGTNGSWKCIKGRVANLFATGKLEGSGSLTYYSSSYPSIVYTDENGTVLQTVFQNFSSLDKVKAENVPSGAVYVMLNNGSGTSLSVTSTSVVDIIDKRIEDIETNLESIESDIGSVESDINSLQDDVEYSTIINKNLLANSTKESGKSFNSQGEIVSSSLCCITDYFAVEPNKNLVLSRASVNTRMLERIRAANFYDENKTYLSTVITPNTTEPMNWLEYITTPDDCAFVRLNILEGTFTAQAYYMLEYGTTPTAYDGYFIPYVIPPSKPFLSDKKICVFGDSLAADGIRNIESSWINRVGNYFGFGTVYNRGEGQSYVTQEDASGTARTSIAYVDEDGYAYDRTAYGSAQTVPSGYTEIDAAMCGDERVATIPIDTDVLIIEAGVNDWASTTQVSDAGATLFSESYELMLSKIITRIPHAKIFCCLCPYYKIGDDASGEHPSYVIGFNKHRGLIKDAAEKFGCTVIDLRSDMGINSINVDDYSSDGLHYYLDSGRARMASTVIGAIESYINSFA